MLRVSEVPIEPWFLTQWISKFFSSLENPLVRFRRCEIILLEFNLKWHYPAVYRKCSIAQEISKINYFLTGILVFFFGRLPPQKLQQKFCSQKFCDAQLNNSTNTFFLIKIKFWLKNLGQIIAGYILIYLQCSTKILIFLKGCKNLLLR